MRFKQRPGAALVAMLCLALGIGASAMSTAFLDAAVLRPFGVQRASEVVVLWEADQSRPQDLIEVSLPTFLDWQRDASSFESMAGFGSSHWPGIGRIRSEHFPIAPRAVSRRFFETLGRAPILGRTFQEEDLAAANAPPVVVSHAFWVSRLGSASDAIGSELLIDNVAHRIIGVMPRGFAFPDAPDAWISVERALGAVFARDGTSVVQQRGLGVLEVVARIRPGRSREQAQSELNTIQRALGQQYFPARQPLVAVITPFADVVLGTLGARLWIALVMTAAVLLFACANVAALRLAQLNERIGELTARLCLGARHSRILTLLLGEMVPLVASAAAAAIVVMLGIAAWLRRVPVVVTSGIDLSEFRPVAGISLLAFAAVAWVLVSVGPALAIVRRLSPVLVTTGTRTVARGSRATSSVLLVQTALAVCLVAMASSAYRMFAALSRADMGFATEGITALDLSVPDWKYPEPPARAALERRLVTRLNALPGVTAAAGVSVRPFRFGKIADGILVRRPEDAGTAREPTGASRVIVSPAFFDAMGIAIEQGRALTEADSQPGRRVAVVSRALMRMLWGEESGLGREIEFPTMRGWNRYLVVGIAEDVRSRVLERPTLEIYVPSGQGGLALGSFVLRHAAGAAPTDTLLRTALGEVDADLVLERSQTTRALVDSVLAPARLLSTAMTMLGATGLTLLALGIFGASATTLRIARREVGIRQAIGATPLGAARAPLRSLLTVLAVGALIGALAAPGAVSVLAAMGVADRGGLASALAAAALAVMAAAGTSIGLNIRRATAASPAELLRTE